MVRSVGVRCRSPFVPVSILLMLQRRDDDRSISAWAPHSSPVLLRPPCWSFLFFSTCQSLDYPLPRSASVRYSTASPVHTRPRLHLADDLVEKVARDPLPECLIL